MNQISEQNACLDAISKIFLGCFILSFLSLLFVFCMIAGAGDYVYAIHSRWFPISEQQFVLVIYTLLALIKTIMFLFFLFPYISIRLILRNR